MPKKAEQNSSIRTFLCGTSIGLDKSETVDDELLREDTVMVGCIFEGSPKEKGFGCLQASSTTLDVSITVDQTP